MKIHIKNGRLIDPKNGIDAQRDIFVAAGKVVAIGDMPTGFGANRVIDATGRIVCPGLVDLAVRLREPGFEYLATLESEMNAAIAGGVTSLACPPDTDPPLDEPGLVEMLKFRAKNLNQAHVYPIGALTTGLKGDRLTAMAELRDAGCVAFSQAEAPFADNLVLLHALEYASTFDFPVWLRAQDPALARLGVAHDDEVATRLARETELRQALETHELEIHFQPEVELGTGQVRAAEALLRWRTRAPSPPPRARSRSRPPRLAPTGAGQARPRRSQRSYQPGRLSLVFAAGLRESGVSNRGSLLGPRQS